MRRIVAPLLACLACSTPTIAEADVNDFYVSGDLCSICSNPYGTPVSQLYDDGLHGDGAAGDGVYGASIVIDGAGRSWSVFRGIAFNVVAPYCACSNAGTARVFANAGETVHFRFFSAGYPAGWQGSRMASDHGVPSGATLELVVDYPIVPGQGDPNFVGYVAPATKQGTIWSGTLVVPTAGSHTLKFRTTDQTVWFGAAYNGSCHCAAPWEEPQITFSTPAPNLPMRFEFDESLGAFRIQPDTGTSAKTSSWGSIKQIYR